MNEYIHIQYVWLSMLTAIFIIEELMSAFFFLHIIAYVKLSHCCFHAWMKICLQIECLSTCLSLLKQENQSIKGLLGNETSETYEAQ